MNALTRSPSPPRPRSRMASLLAVTTILLLALLPMQPGMASAQVAPSQALFMSATVVSVPSGLVAVHGEGFSPGGLVYIAITGNDGRQVFHDGWTVASDGIYGPNGSQDPAQGYIPTGGIVEVVSLASAIVYGPYGSQDRTQTYIPGQDDAWMAALCNHDLDVQAYDAETQTWTERLDLVLSDEPCGLLAGDEAAAQDVAPSSSVPAGRERAY